MRVRRPADPAPTTLASPLASDSLAWSLLLAARAIAAVRDGRSLSEALRALAGEPAAARAAAQDVAYGVFRRHGQGDFILSKLLSKALGHAETEALLLAALYRIETHSTRCTATMANATAR